MDPADATLIGGGAALIIGACIVLCVVRWREQRELLPPSVETIPAWR